MKSLVAVTGEMFALGSTSRTHDRCHVRRTKFNIQIEHQRFLEVKVKTRRPNIFHVVLGLRWFSSKQPKLWLTQEFFSRISESTTGYTFTTCVGSFTSLA